MDEQTEQGTDEFFVSNPAVWRDRHPSVQHFQPLFAFDHLPEGPERDTSEAFAAMAEVAVEQIPDNRELAAGLRKLLEARDCMLRAVQLSLPPQ